jgi:hypothetical protein
LAKILTVGLRLASDDVEFSGFRSKTALLDWDIILFKPGIAAWFRAYKEYQGKPSYDESTSFELTEACEHWRREVKEALDIGKTVIVFLSEVEHVYVDTGQRSHSGTGRNQKTTIHVASYSSYAALPVDLMPVPTKGRAMKLSPRGAETIASYWADFESASRYEVTLGNSKAPACVLTRSGDKVVGALYRSKLSTGALLLLPDIEFDEPEGFFQETQTYKWSPDATQFAARMVSAVVQIHKTLRAGAEITPTPIWATERRFVLATERKLQLELLEAEQRSEEAQRSKERAVEKLRHAGALRGLVFEKGKTLENAVIEALRIIGFSAERFQESDSEFDVVFESAEGRLIGEVEGKDNKPVNIDKLRQLSLNVHEDLQRDSVDAPAKPVLFGNAFRLQPVDERADPFTEKCYRAAGSSGVALVFTPDLFWAVQYLEGVSDPEYAKACRVALASATGRAILPPVPQLESLPDEANLQMEASALK